MFEFINKRWQAGFFYTRKAHNFGLPRFKSTAILRVYARKFRALKLYKNFVPRALLLLKLTCYLAGKEKTVFARKLIICRLLEVSFLSQLAYPKTNAREATVALTQRS